MVQKLKRALALLLMVLLLFSAVPLTSSAALANGSSGHWKKLGYYGSPHWKYNFSGDGKTQWGLQHASPQGEATKLSFTNSEGDHLAYCMELGSTANEGKNTTVSTNFAQYLHPSTNLSTAEKKIYIERAFFYGYTGGATRYGHTTDEERYATQIMIWMIASGDSSDSKISDTSVFNQDSASLNDRENGFVDKCTSNVPATNKASIKDTLSKMKEQMVTHTTIPSFMTGDVTKAHEKIRQLNYNSATGFYENVTRLPDDHGVISYYESATDGVIFKISDNVLTIQTKKIIPANAPLTVTANRSKAKYSNPVYLMVGGWSKDVAGQQGCAATSGKTDPVHAYMSIWTNAVGSLKLIKTADVRAGEPALPVSGIQFRVTGPNGFNQTVTTGADGTFTLGNLTAGTYTVKEIVTEGQICTSQNPQTVTVTAGVTSSVTFENRWQKCMVELSKYDAESPDERLAGAEFHVVVTKGSWRGEDNMTEVDGSPGLFRHGPTAYGATITITETKAPVGYVPLEKPIVIPLNDDTIQKYGVADTSNPDNDWIIKVKLDENGNLSPDGVEGVPNKMIRGKLKIVKKDSETQAPLAGATFQLVSSATQNVSGTDINITKVTAANGEVVFEDLPYGTYAYLETKPPVGYKQSIPLTLVEINEDGKTVEVEALNTPIKYNLKIVKKDGETQTPLKGAQFNLYETQGYDAKNPPGTAKLVASAVTDASGELTFKNIRYGQYILRETQAPTGYVLDRWLSAGIPILLMEDMANLSFQNGTFTYEATNEMIRGHLKIVKKDAAAVTIPLEGAGFRVYSAAKDNVSGEEVSREGYTNADGEITFRDLPYGKYTYQEIEAPKGYQLDETVYDFNIAEQGVTITKNAFNRRLPGSISVHKTDDSGKPLAGVKFLLEFSMDGATWLPVQRAPILSGSANVVPGGCTSPGLQNGVLVTDEDGNAVFSGLFTSIGTSRTLYRLTELETLDGYQLLSEPVFEGALKIGEEIDISFTVVNKPAFVLPATGGIGVWPIIVIAFVLAGGAGCCAVVLRKKRRKTNQ